MTLLRTLFFFSLLVLAKNLSAEPKPDPFVPVTHPQAPGTTPSPAPTEGPANSGSIDNLDSFIQALEANADFNQARSKCASGVSFKNGKRVGRMSPGYFYGMMLTFAKTVCKVKDSSYGSGDKYADTLLAQAGQSTQKDTFLHKDYKESLKGDPLIQNYSLLLSLGMLESGGMYNEGIDRTANNTDGITTEAGLFQVSYNSVNQYQVPREIYNDLMRKYNRGQDATACMTGVFKIGQSLSKNTESFGSGAALEFQNAMKACPAMAVEYMSVLLRKDVNHNGPLKREEAQPSAECSQALGEVKKVAESNCGQLDTIAKSIPNPKLKFSVAEDRKSDREMARNRGGSSISRLERELEELKAERDAASPEEQAAYDERIKAAETALQTARQNPEQVAEKDAVDTKISEAQKENQIKNEELLQAITGKEGYQEPTPEFMDSLSQEAEKLNVDAQNAEALARDEKKKAREDQNPAVFEAAKKARKAATDKEEEYAKAKQVKALQESVANGEKALQSKAVDSVKAKQSTAKADTDALQTKQSELSAAQKARQEKGEKEPSQEEKKLSEEIQALEKKSSASQKALEEAKEIDSSLSEMKAEFKVEDRNPAIKSDMIDKLTSQLEEIEKRITALKADSGKRGNKDRLLLLLQLKRQLRSELRYYQNIGR